MKESYLYKKLKGQQTQCQTCNHKCLISPGKRGICGVRKNQNGKLYLLVYGKVIAAHIDPIEKKPFYHFLPGTKSFSIAAVGCNFKCLWCQNWQISQASKDPEIGHKLEILGENWPPERIIDRAIKTNCQSISYTYTEPTIFLEYALDIMKLAHKKGIKNCWVSNGYFSFQALKKIAPYLDAINIDLKGFNKKHYLKYSGAKLTPVLENIKTITDKKIHLEITTLIIPTINDSKKELTQIAQFIASINKKIPWHISRFFPTYKMSNLLPTPIETLQKTQKIGQKAGLKYVYIGNI